MHQQWIDTLHQQHPHPHRETDHSIYDEPAAQRCRRSRSHQTLPQDETSSHTEKRSNLEFMSQLFRPPRAISHHLRSVLFEARIGQGTFRPPGAALSDTAQCREPDHGNGNGAHGNAHGNLCPCRQTCPALGGGLGWWLGKSVLYG